MPGYRSANYKCGVMLATNQDLPSETFDLAVMPRVTSGLMKKKQPERIFPAVVRPDGSKGRCV